MPDVVVDGLTLRRGGALVLDGVSFTAPAGRVTVVVGPSGAGKTSLVRAIARLDEVERGTIRFGERDVTHEPAGRAGSALTFQQAALFPHRDVGRNVSFPLELDRVDVDEVRRRVGDELQALQIGALLHRRPNELSVGEAQMVQLARALIRTPEVILLDEPFASLEGERSRVLRAEIRALQERVGATIVASTNDPDDARRFADTVVVLDRGRLVQVGSADDVFERPDTVAAAHLTGDATVDVVTVEVGDDGWWLVHPAFRVRGVGTGVRRPRRPPGPAGDAPGVVGARPARRGARRGAARHSLGRRHHSDGRRRRPRRDGPATTHRRRPRRDGRRRAAATGAVGGDRPARRPPDRHRPLIVPVAVSPARPLS
jgi:ABC-type sugar transport system ATPase subunit